MTAKVQATTHQANRHGQNSDRREAQEGIDQVASVQVDKCRPDISGAENEERK